MSGQPRRRQLLGGLAGRLPLRPQERQDHPPHPQVRRLPRLPLPGARMGPAYHLLSSEKLCFPPNRKLLSFSCNNILPAPGAEKAVIAVCRWRGRSAGAAELAASGPQGEYGRGPRQDT